MVRHLALDDERHRSGAVATDVGLYADSGRAEECWSPRGTVDDSAHPEGGRSSTRTAAADLMANVSQGALGVIAAADFFTTEVWTWQGVVTYYTVFVIDLASRWVQILGSTPHPETLFMQQVTRTLTMADAGVVAVPQVLICDRDRKWSRDVRRRLRAAGIRVVLIPERAPNANAYAERFVRSIKEECLNRLIPIGERHVRRAVAEFVEHYHRERNHQGLGNALIAGVTASGAAGQVRRHPRLGGLLNFYDRAA